MRKALYSVIAVTSSCRRHDRSTASGWRPHGRRNSCPSSRIHLFVTEIKTSCTVLQQICSPILVPTKMTSHPLKFIHAEWWKRLVASELRTSDSNENRTKMMRFLMAYYCCIVNCRFTVNLPHFCPSSTGQPACSVFLSNSPDSFALYQNAAPFCKNTHVTHQ